MVKTLIEIDLAELAIFFKDLTQYSRDEQYENPYCRAGDKDMSFCFNDTKGGVLVHDVDFKVVEPIKELIRLKEENKRLKNMLLSIERMARG